MTCCVQSCLSLRSSARLMCIEGVSRCFPLCPQRCTEAGYEGWNEGANFFRSSALAWKYTDLLLGMQGGMPPDPGQFVELTFGFTQSSANFRATRLGRTQSCLASTFIANFAGASKRGTVNTIENRTRVESSRVEPSLYAKKNGGPHWAQARKRRHVNKLQNIFTFKAGRSR